MVGLVCVSAAGLKTISDRSSCSPETKLFHIKVTDLHVSKEDFAKSRSYQL